MDNNEDEDSNFVKKYPLIFKKYKPIKKLAKGAFSVLYYGINTHTKEKIAIKIEKRKTINKYLESECFILFSLKGLGIPKVLSFGHNKEYDILIMPLLGKSLQNLYISKNMNFEFKDICLMGIQIIERIQWVHSQKIIHRDIKPDNFLIGLNDPNVIYLIDFGLSKKYRSSQTGKHIKFTEVKKFTGTIRYASVNSLRLRQQSRRDDLESIGYMLIYFIKGSLPWMGIKVTNKKEQYLKLSQIKKNIKPEKLCENLPVELLDYVKYVKNLHFEENPDYTYLKYLFEKMLKKQGFDEDNIYFSWISESAIKKIRKPVNLSKRTSYSRERIYNKIKKNLDNSNRSLSEIRKINSFNNFVDSENKFKNNIIKKNLEEEFNNNNQYESTLNNCNRVPPGINYINNSINNNFISISVSLPKNTNFKQNNVNVNQNYKLNDEQNLQNYILNKNSIKKEFKEVVSEGGYKINLNKNNKSKIYIEKNNKSNNIKYQQFYPKYIENKDILNINSSINFNTSTNSINNYKNINNINYNFNNNTPNIYAKKFLSSDIKNDNKNLTDNSNTHNNSNNYNTYNNISNNNNNVSNLYNRNIKNNMIKAKNNNFFNSYNLSYNNLEDIKKNSYIIKNISTKKNNSNNNIKLFNNINESVAIKNKNILKNFYNWNIKDKKLLNISPYVKKQKSAINQNNNKNKYIDNNELKNEIKRFNIRYNTKENISDKKLIKNKVKKILNPRSIQNNQSADHNKFMNLKNSVNGLKFNSYNNNENNCIIS